MEDRPNQSAPTPPQTFHVQGTIKNTADEPVFRVKVTFQSKAPGKADVKADVQVDTDGQGFYQTDLLLGDYTMTAQSLGLRPYRRPFFRVTAPTRLTFDVTLREFAACDELVAGNGDGRPRIRDPRGKGANRRRLPTGVCRYCEDVSAGRQVGAAEWRAERETGRSCGTCRCRLSSC